MTCDIYDKELRQVCSAYAGVPEELEGIYGDQLFCYRYVDENYPPAFIITSYYDMLLRYAWPLSKELSAAGVENELHVYGSLSQPEIGHSFNTQIQYKEAQKCAGEMCAFFKANMK